MKDPRITKVPRSQWQQGIEIPLEEMAYGEVLQVTFTYHGTTVASVSVSGAQQQAKDRIGVLLYGPGGGYKGAATFGRRRMVAAEKAKEG